MKTVEWAEAPKKGDAADAVAQSVDVLRLINDAEEWQPGNVNLAKVLDDLVAFVRRYVVLTNQQLWALVLWIGHTYALEAADCTPYISIKSAEKQSGKTLLLEILNLLVANPWFTGRVTAAVLVRKISRDAPTLLLDETDAAFKGDKEFSETLRGVLNSGYRRGGVVSLCVKVGSDFDLRDFPVFCAKALAGIGRLPDTIQDRSIPIELRRKSPSEKAKRFRVRDAKPDAEKIIPSLDCWAASAIPILEQARPAIPEDLGDRSADVWEPLLAIADMAGGDWPTRAREAALSLSGKTVKEDDSLGVMLLRDIQTVFEERALDRLPTAELVSALLKIEESPWGDLWGKTLDARRLASLLKPYGIAPKQRRLQDQSNKKGYEVADFRDSWERYIPPVSETSETGKQTTSSETGESVSDVSANNDGSETNSFVKETFSEQDEPDVSDVSLVSVPQGVRDNPVADVDSQYWEEGDI